jgi:hypothetical protein
MTEQRLVAVYYPNSYIENPRSLASYALYFDEIRLITLSDFSIDPTSYLANLPDKFYVYSMGGADKEIDRRVLDFYRFALDYKPLIGQVIFYEPHLLSNKVGSIADKMLGEDGLSLEEFYEFITGESEEQKAITDFENRFPELNDDILLRVAPTALHLARENGWQLISDDEDLPVPHFSNVIRNAKQLSSLIAEECLLINLPAAEQCTAEEMLEIRHQLQPELEPFRNLMFKASRMLREQLSADFRIDDIREEARFFVETQINPLIAELERRISLEQGRLWRKVFGRLVGWIPIIVNGFLAPSTENIYKALSKASKDVEDLILKEHDVTMLRDPGIAFLLKVRGLSMPNS